MKSHGPWKIKKTNNIYRDSYIHVWRDDVIRPDGFDGQHVVVSMKAGVCVLALDEEDNVYLTREFHYGIGRMSVEAVSGGIEENEQPEVTARRELQEELGLNAERWEYLSTVDPFTTIVYSPTKLYLATGLTETSSNPEGTEVIERLVVPLAEAARLVKAGEITHAPSCILILLAWARSSDG